MARSRTQVIAGNWKMYKTQEEACSLAAALRSEAGQAGGVEVVLCPPFTALKTVADAVAGSAIGVGGQNMHWEAEGAFTGEVSARMLRDVGCRYVILGHSERRSLFGETDATVNRKVKAAQAAGLVPIVCVGETLEQRDAGRAQDVVRTQVMGSLAGLGADTARLIVAYEPVWAIGTGRTATPQIAQEMHAVVRRALSDLGGGAVAGGIRILYGGSVKPANAADLLAQPDIDGALVGGASLDAASFMGIVRAAVR